MAFSELYVCDNCDHDAVLIHAEEWSPASEGAMVRFSGTGRVGGLLNRLWCPTCRTVREHAFVNLSPPAEHAVVAYAEAQRLGCDGNETGPCRVCGTQLTWKMQDELCPACGSGHFQFTGEWEDAI